MGGYDRRSRVQIAIDDLLNQLAAAHNVLRITQPDEVTRARYRLIARWAVELGHVSRGTVLTRTNEDTGDLLIELVSRPVRDIAVPVPATHDPRSPIARSLTKASARLQVSRDLRPRSLRLIEAIAEAASEVGFQVVPANVDARTFSIEQAEQSFSFTLSEEMEKGSSPPPSRNTRGVPHGSAGKLASAQKVPSGRLRLELHGRLPKTWADRKRWRLDDKLPDVIATVEMLAAVDRQERIEVEEERQRHRRVWEVAVATAREMYIADLNGRTLDSQALASDRAESMRRYCARLEQLAAAENGVAERQVIFAWLSLARERAQQLDPLTPPVSMLPELPSEIPVEELKKWMPPGMTADGPRQPRVYI